jgi:hypothetical protein
VTARSPLLEEDQSRVQQTISDRLVHSLPLVGRNFLPLASLAAGSPATPTSRTRRGRTTRPTTCWSTAPAISRSGAARRGRSIPATASKRSRKCAS